MSLTDRMALANDNDFRTKVLIASVQLADTKLTAGTDEFFVLKYAQHIKGNPTGGWLNQMVYEVLSNPGIAANPTDSDIEYTVSQRFESAAKLHYANV